MLHGVVPRTQPAAAQKQVAVLCKRHAVRRQDAIQRGQRALGQPPLPVKRRLRAERAAERQQKAQR